MPRYAPFNNTATVTVEYDCRGSRQTKKFDSIYQAKSFYISKMKQGKNPTILKAERN